MRVENPCVEGVKSTGVLSLLLAMLGSAVLEPDLENIKLQ